MSTAIDYFQEHGKDDDNFSLFHLIVVLVINLFMNMLGLIRGRLIGKIEPKMGLNNIKSMIGLLDYNTDYLFSSNKLLWVGQIIMQL